MQQFHLEAVFVDLGVKSLQDLVQLVRDETATHLLLLGIGTTAESPYRVKCFLFYRVLNKVVYDVLFFALF